MSRLHLPSPPAEASSMETDLFKPQDAAALLAIRAINAQHRLTPEDLLAAFAARGLLDDVDVELPLAA